MEAEGQEDNEQLQNIKLSNLEEMILFWYIDYQNKSIRYRKPEQIGHK